MQVKRTRILFLAGSICFALICIIILHVIFYSLDGRLGKLLIGTNSTLYPFSIQNILYLCFVIGMGELGYCYKSCLFEERLFKIKLLPESDEVVLSLSDVLELRKRIIKHYGNTLPGTLLNLVNRCILQFQTTGAIGEAHNLLNSLLEIYSHRIELKYTFVRYLAWLIPTLGFIGTITGIAGSLEGFGVDGAEPNFDAIKSSLYTAFDTTLLALILSALLIFFIHLCSSKEERMLNSSAEYCLVNLINRLTTRR